MQLKAKVESAGSPVTALNQDNFRDGTAREGSGFQARFFYKKNMNTSNQEYKNFLNGDLEYLDREILSEQRLVEIAHDIDQLEERTPFIKGLILSLPKFNRVYDWNIGSIIRHFESSLIIDVLKSIDDWNRFYSSIGLVWVLGEYNNHHPIIVEFLQNALKKTKDSDVWWRSAFSLERIGVDDAVNLLKQSLKNNQLNELEYYFENVGDKKSIISILILSNTDNIEKEIYPKIKNIFLTTEDSSKIISCCWLIGRLKLIDEEIVEKLVKLINSENYETKYYTLFALQNNSPELLTPIMIKTLDDKDSLIRKMAVRGLVNIGNDSCLEILKNKLKEEADQVVIAEICKAIYAFKNSHNHNKLLIELKSLKNENGLIFDETDKWYQDPAIYHIFSESEDPENVCLDLILDKIKGKKIINPIDLATGTGRMLWQIMNKIPYDGVLHGLDLSSKMCEFLEKNIKRERMYVNKIKVINSSIIDAHQQITEKSNFIVNSFGFPSKISNKKLVMEELRAVHDLLTDDGMFFTIGWDETFNDELNEMWFKYVPDKILADNFEDWRRSRSSAITSPRNANLTWMKTGLWLPLQYTSLNEAAQVMGYLFGRDAAQYTIKTGKIEWNMSMGITYNTKEEIGKILKKYERS